VTKQEIAAELNAIQATIDALLDKIVGMSPQPKAPAKKSGKKTPRK
jgi:hypothetical protein